MFYTQSSVPNEAKVVKEGLMRHRQDLLLMVTSMAAAADTFQLSFIARAVVSISRTFRTHPLASNSRETISNRLWS